MPATLRPSSIDSRVRPNVAVTFGPEFQGDMKFFGGVADYTEAYTGWHLFPLQYGFENMLEDLLATREVGRHHRFVCQRCMDTRGSRRLPQVGHDQCG